MEKCKSFQREAILIRIRPLTEVHEATMMELVVEEKENKFYLSAASLTTSHEESIVNIQRN